MDKQRVHENPLEIAQEESNVPRAVDTSFFLRLYIDPAPPEHRASKQEEPTNGNQSTVRTE